MRAAGVQREPADQGTRPAEACARDGRALAPGEGFRIGGRSLCTRHALGYPPMLRRSVATAAFVGAVLVAINQGNVLLDGEFPQALWWKVPLTYAVPFFVATWGALINSRR